MSIKVIDDGGLGLLEALLKQYNALQADFVTLQTAFNTHVHTTAGATYVQGASTTVPTALDNSVTSQTITKKI